MSSSCSGACPCSRRSSATTSSGSPQVVGAAHASSPARRCSARATRATPATSCATATRGRSAAHGDGRTITLATFGPGDIFGELAMFEDERRSATVEAIEQIERRGGARPGHAPADERAPRDRDALVIALGRRLRETNERLSRQSFQTVQSRVAVVLGQLVEQARRRRARRPRTCSSPPPRPISRSSPAPRASPPAASSRCSSAPGVISQGRGRLIVHDPEALKQYVF